MRYVNTLRQHVTGYSTAWNDGGFYEEKHHNTLKRRVNVVMKLLTEKLQICEILWSPWNGIEAYSFVSCEKLVLESNYQRMCIVKNGDDSK